MFMKRMTTTRFVIVVIKNIVIAHLAGAIFVYKDMYPASVLEFSLRLWKLHLLIFVVLFPYLFVTKRKQTYEPSEKPNKNFLYDLYFYLIYMVLLILGIGSGAFVSK